MIKEILRFARLGSYDFLSFSVFASIVLIFLVSKRPDYTLTSLKKLEHLEKEIEQNKQSLKKIQRTANKILNKIK